MTDDTNRQNSEREPQGKQTTSDQAAVPVQPGGRSGEGVHSIRRHLRDQLNSQPAPLDIKDAAERAWKQP